MRFAQLLSPMHLHLTHSFLTQVILRHLWRRRQRDLLPCRQYWPRLDRSLLCFSLLLVARILALPERVGQTIFELLVLGQFSQLGHDDLGHTFRPILEEGGVAEYVDQFYLEARLNIGLTFFG